jgi:hypothetical protein
MLKLPGAAEKKEEDYPALKRRKVSTVRIDVPTRVALVWDEVICRNHRDVARERPRAYQTPFELMTRNPVWA